MSDKGCCYKCEDRKVYKEGDRFVSCHSTCERWEKQQKQKAKKNALVKKQKQKDNICKGYANDCKNKNDKWKRGHKK